MLCQNMGTDKIFREIGHCKLWIIVGAARSFSSVMAALSKGRSGRCWLLQLCNFFGLLFDICFKLFNSSFLDGKLLLEFLYSLLELRNFCLFCFELLLVLGVRRIFLCLGGKHRFETLHFHLEFFVVLFELSNIALFSLQFLQHLLCNAFPNSALQSDCGGFEHSVILVTALHANKSL